MRIVDRYIGRELLGPFFLGVGAFVVILVGDVLYTLAEYLARGRISAGVLVTFLAYKLPAIMVITFPVSTLFGALLGLGRLVRDRELQAMRLAGMSLTRIFAPVLAFGLLMAGLTFITNERITPWGNSRANTLIRRVVFGDGSPQVREQVFFRGPANRYFYIQHIDEQQHLLQNVMIYELTPTLPRLVTAQKATWEDRVWHLHSGVVRELDPDGFTSYEAGFVTMDIPIDVDERIFFAGQKTPDEMTAGELRQYLRMFGGGVSPRFAVEFHRKFAVPLAGLVFALIAAPLSVHASLGGRFLGVGMCIVLLFLYYAVMSMARALGVTGALTPALAAWLPNLLFLGVGLALWAIQDAWFHGRMPARMVAKVARPS